MTPTLANIIDTLETIAPPHLAEKWDNVGLQIGHPDQLVEKIWVALDPSLQVICAACENSIDLLITHHPLFFTPTRAIDLKTPIGTIIEKTIRCGLSIYSAHTNFDSVADGLNDTLAKQIGLENLSIIQPVVTELDGSTAAHGLGRIGDLKQATDLTSLASHLKGILNLSSLRIVGPPQMTLNRVAICTGSGASLIQKVLASDVQAFITGDVRYHDAKIAEDANLGLIDIGHFGSEHIMVESVSNKLKAAINKNQWSVNVSPCVIEQDPFHVL